MDFITSIDSVRLDDMIQSAKNRIILSAPGIFQEVANSIEKKYQSGLKNIKLIINCSEQTIRQGFGEISVLTRLKNIGISTYHKPENFVSFIITDDSGYFLFPQSRIFLEDDHKVKNAIAIDPFSLEQLIAIFFPPRPSEKKELENKLSNALIISSERINNIDQILEESINHKAVPLNDLVLNTVKIAIETNPPLHPDLKRQLEYYNTNFLWIDLKFKGSKISSKTITIPKHILPIDSNELRNKLTSHLKLFENADTTWFYKLKKITNEVTRIRKKFLTPIKWKDGKNIILKSNYQDFNKHIETLKSEISNVKSEVEKKLTEEIINTKQRFIEILVDYYKAHPTKELESISENEIDNETKTFVEYKVDTINFPEV